MKELEKTKRISISAVLFLLVIVIGILTFEKPEHIFKKNTEATLQEITNNRYILTLNELDTIDPSQYKLIDVRNNFEYAKGFMQDAINISTNDILEKGNINLFNELLENNKLAVLYGENPNEANNAWTLLYQLGYENVKILCVETSYVDNTFYINTHSLEKPAVNFAEVMQSSKHNSEVSNPKVLKKIITIPKKKKIIPEGGC
jgi:rhodanese-related sulfurtransferase